MSYIGRSPQLGVRTRFYYTATGGETSLSGADDNGATLIFSDGTYVDVLLNGITLVAGVDYNTSTANTISGLAALTSGDVAEIVVYDVFSVGDAVSASNGGTFAGPVVFTDQLIQRFAIYTTNQTLKAGTLSVVNSASDLTMTLPASPAAGDTLTIRNSGTGTVTVGRNGSNILSLAEDGTLNAGTSTQLVYVDATIGWDQL